MNVLFICSRNKWRSRTAETVFKDTSGWNVRSAGTAASAQVKGSAKILEWADVILVMEKRHRSILQQIFADAIDGKELIVPGIPNDYQYMDPTLIEELKNKVSILLKKQKRTSRSAFALCCSFYRSICLSRMI